MIRVIIADDHPIVRHGLRHIVEEEPQMRVVGEAANGDEVLELVSRILADALLLDIGMPGPGIFLLMDEIKERRPALPILILSIYPEEHYAARLMRLGASGYLTKDVSPELLTRAIRRVASGRRFLSPGLAEALVDRGDAGPPALRHELLSDREFQVFVRLSRGQSVGAIARQLGLSPKTVSTYRSRVLNKLRLSSLAELVRYALEHGLV